MKSQVFRALCRALAATAVALAGGAWAQEITLYEHPDFGGRAVTLRGDVLNLQDAGFANRASSLVVRSGNWLVCTEPNRGGTCLTYWQGDQVRSLSAAFNDRVSSVTQAAGAAAATTTQRGMVELFEGYNFTGRRIVIEQDTYDMAAIGFNDVAKSAVVRAGSWEMCRHKDMRGTCRTFSQGSYADLGEGLVNEVSSLRMVAAPTAAPVPVQPRGLVELFEGHNFQGKSMRFETDTPDLDPLQFNDRTLSAIVHSGTWEMCVDGNYRGSCRTYAPGRYADIGAPIERNLSSLRIVQSAAVAAVPAYGEPQVKPKPNPRVVGEDVGAGGGAAPAYSQTPRASLYEGTDFGGRGMQLNRPVDNLEVLRFNDGAASLIVDEGSWELCSDAGFRGTCRTFGPGRYNRLPGELLRRVSSLRPVGSSSAPVGGTPYQGPVPVVDSGGGDIEVYDQTNFAGSRYGTSGDIANMNDRGFNDRAQSVIVNRGTWEVCTDANYRGRCATLAQGRYANLYEFNAQISSMRRIGN